MHRIFVLGVVLTALFSGESAFAQAKKGKVNCSVDACMAQCGKVGGNTRVCPAYCSKQISDRKAAGQC